MIDRNTKILIALPFVLIIVGLMTAKLIHFKPALTAEEMRMLRFVSEKIDIPQKRIPTTYRNLRSPIEIVKTKKGFPPIPLSEIVPATSTPGAKGEKQIEPKVSMIIISEGRRIAILNGMVVKEGDSLGNMIIAKIEKDRVLIKEQRGNQRVGGPLGIRSRWVYLEGMK